MNTYNGYPNGITRLVIHELKKAVQNKINALTETIDDAIDAVNDAPNAIIKINYDDRLKTLTVSDFGYGSGMTEKVCGDILSNFYSHNFTNPFGISRFGLGRYYPFAIMGNHPNITFKTSIGDGKMIEMKCEIPDIDNEEWKRCMRIQPCEKNIHGTEVMFQDVCLTDDEISEMKRVYSIHYAMSKCTIIFNNNELDKYNPCYIEELPDGVDTADGIYAINGLVYHVQSHIFKCGEKTVKFKTIAVHITKNGVQYIKDNSKMFKTSDEITSALNGGFYGCVGSNIVNKGNNAKDFFDLTFTRGGSGVTRLFMKVIQDDDNIFGINDVKAIGYKPFFLHYRNLNEFKNNDGQKLYDCIFEIFKKCRKLYDRVGQDKHRYTDDELYKFGQETYNPSSKKVDVNKLNNTAKRASKDAHVKYIEKMYDYVTPKEEIEKIKDEFKKVKRVLKVEIPKNKENTLNIEVNTNNLPSNWSQLTKEDILIGVGKFIIEEIEDSTILEKFNEKFIKYICHYENL